MSRRVLARAAEFALYLVLFLAAFAHSVKLSEATHFIYRNF